MRAVTKEQVIECLQRLGLQPGDGLLVHSAVQFLGQPAGGVGMYLEAIQAVIDPQGTLAVPTFNFEFARGKPYNPQKTPSVGMGAFSEYVRQHPAALRTLHPLQSLAVIGQHSSDLANRDTLSAFDPGSAFERLLELNFKLLLLGADGRAVSMFHYSEQRAKVPYRYWKEFSGEYHTLTGIENRTYRMYVRDLDLNPQLTIDPVVALLEERGQWHSLLLNYGQITTCSLHDFVAAVDHFLFSDPWSLVINRPPHE